MSLDGRVSGINVVLETVVTGLAGYPGDPFEYGSAFHRWLVVI